VQNGAALQAGWDDTNNLSEYSCGSKGDQATNEMQQCQDGGFLK
jgi:hypothetical protein